jgi:hypothetical protein
MALFVTDGSNEKEIELMYQVSKMILGSIPIYICPDEKGYQHMRISPVPKIGTLAIYTDKGLIVNRHQGALDNFKSLEFIKNWIISNKNAMVPQFTVANQDELTSSTYLVIMMLDPNDPSDFKQLNDFRLLAKEWNETHPKLNNVKFAYLDGVMYRSYTENVYGIMMTDYPCYVITHPREEIFYDARSDGSPLAFTKESLFDALLEVMNGRGTPKSTKGFIGLAIYRFRRFNNGILVFLSGSLLGFTAFVTTLVFGTYYFCFRSSQYQELSSDVADSKLD